MYKQILWLIGPFPILPMLHGICPSACTNDFMELEEGILISKW